jgi:DNA invertase Pin-like site-specific DNA recombinase
MTRHVAVYLRVSTGAQSTKSQEPDIDRWIAAQDEPIVRYVDHATGTRMDRPAWRKVEEAIRSGRVSRLVVWRLDRLGRTVSGLSLLFEELERLGSCSSPSRTGSTSPRPPDD